MNLFTNLDNYEQYIISINNLKSSKKVRKRNKEPIYLKFYSIYQYDRKTFYEELKKIPEDERTPFKQKDILNKCYIYDDLGNKKRDSDEAHIFRIKALQKIHELIFYYCNEFKITTISDSPYLNYCKIDKYGLWVYPDEGQAEIPNTWQLPIKERLIIHIGLLRRLKNGMKIEEAVNDTMENRKKKN